MEDSMTEAFQPSPSFGLDAISEQMLLLRETFDFVRGPDWCTALAALTLLYLAYQSLLWHWRLGHYGKRYILVTGCDSGFGFQTVQRLDSLGFHVFAGCLTSEGLERLTRVTSRRVTPLSLDVTDLANIKDVVARMTAIIPPRLGLWAVINNAGIMPSMAPLELTPHACFQRTLAVNLVGTVEMTRACLPLVRRARGRVVNMSSVSGRLGFVAVDYTVSKFAVEGFTEYLRREARRDGVTVSVVAPGGFQTKLCDFDQYFASMQRELQSLDPALKTHFGEDFVASRRRAFDRFYLTFNTCSASLDPVVEAYVHAVSARFPRARYVVGLDANLLFRPLGLLPACVADCIFTTWPIDKVLL